MDHTSGASAGHRAAANGQTPGEFASHRIYPVSWLCVGQWVKVLEHAVL
jgi:hypothetical protein